jgi:hypothetical protein
MAKANRAPMNETALQRSSRIAKERHEMLTASEPLVTPEAHNHNQYDTRPRAMPGGGKREATVNITSSAVNRWLADEDERAERALEDGEPFNRLFFAEAIRAIEHCEKKWAIIDGKCASEAKSPISGNLWLGEAEQDARDVLRRYELMFKNTPQLWWVFEDVVRYDEPAGRAGSHMAHNSRSAIDAARIATASVAGWIAEKRG